MIIISRYHENNLKKNAKEKSHFNIKIMTRNLLYRLSGFFTDRDKTQITSTIDHQTPTYNKKILFTDREARKKIKF